MYQYISITIEELQRNQHPMIPENTHVAVHFANFSFYLFIFNKPVSIHFTRFVRWQHSRLHLDDPGQYFSTEGHLHLRRVTCWSACKAEACSLSAQYNSITSSFQNWHVNNLLFDLTSLLM